MKSLAFLGISLGGGALALFLSAGWSSFKHKKIPETSILFRWFVAGLVAAGCLAYVWIFGSGGDLSAVVDRIGGALDLENVMKLTALGVGAVGAVGASDSSKPDDGIFKEDENTPSLTVGMPNF